MPMKSAWTKMDARNTLARCTASITSQHMQDELARPGSDGVPDIGGYNSGRHVNAPDGGCTGNLPLCLPQSSYFLVG